MVYLKDHHCQGRQKIQDIWSPVLYKVVGVPTEPGGPYTITQADGNGNVRRVTRTELRAVQFTQTAKVHGGGKGRCFPEVCS